MAETNGFTLAIDYCFTKDSTYAQQYSAATLASCYNINATGNTVSGFALYDYLQDNDGITAAGPRVGFGDMFSNGTKSKPVGTSATKSQRNMIVLRRPANSDTLFIYSGLTDNASIPENVVTQQIQWSDEMNNAQLIFGRITNSNDLQYATIQNAVANGKGTIYRDVWRW